MNDNPACCVQQAWFQRCNYAGNRRLDRWRLPLDPLIEAMIAKKIRTSAATATKPRNFYAPFDPTIDGKL